MTTTQATIKAQSKLTLADWQFILTGISATTPTDQAIRQGDIVMKQSRGGRMGSYWIVVSRTAKTVTMAELPESRRSAPTILLRQLVGGEAAQSTLPKSIKGA